VRGIILAGGTATRLQPATLVVSKHLLPVFDKPMIYYPLAVLLAAGVREILVITTPRDRPLFRALLGDGSQFGATISYAIQRIPRGIPEALRIGRRFAAGQRTALILGDNVFHGRDVLTSLAAASQGAGAHCFASRVPNPEEYGIVEFDGSDAVSLTEKPRNGRSRWALTGLYVFPANVWTRTEKLVPSRRGELEITDMLRAYLEQDALTVHRLARRTRWIDAGTPGSLLAASQFVSSVQRRSGIPVGSPEYAAVASGLVTRARMRKGVRASSGEYAQMVARALARPAS
jgi:glucose-1-phosphate thymidylyltransferase